MSVRDVENANTVIKVMIHRAGHKVKQGAVEERRERQENSTESCN